MKRRKKHPYLTQDGQDRESDPAQYIVNFHDGCIAGYKYFQFAEPDPVVAVTLRSHGGKAGTGRLIVSTDSDFSSLVGQDIVEMRENQLTTPIMLHIKSGVYPPVFQIQGMWSI